MSELKPTNAERTYKATMLNNLNAAISAVAHPEPWY